MAHLVKSKTVESAKNKWATRWDCFFDAQFLFRRDTGKEFVLDVAAEPQTAKVNRFYVAPDWINEQPSGFPSLKPKHKAAQLLNPVCVGFDGLQGEWEDGWWCNPPFDLKFEFLEKALEQARKGRDGMMLLPHEELTTWWLDLVEGYATMIYKPDGRYPFYETDGHTKKQGVNFGSALVLFTEKGLQTPSMRFNRKVGRTHLTDIYEQIAKVA
ncbi:hypothetical protein ACEC70_003896 [Vibrio alginolyticus]